MRHYKVVLFFVIAFALGGCIKREDFEVTEFRGVKMESTSSVKVTLEIENRSGRNVTVENARLYVEDRGERVATIQLKHAVTIPKRSKTDVQLDLAVKLDNPLGMLRLMSMIRTNGQGITVSGEGKAKSGIMKKKFEVKSVPMSHILTTFGADKKELFKPMFRL